MMKKKKWLAGGVLAIVLAVAGTLYLQYQQEKSHGSVAVAYEQEATAIFAGGCFWCMEPPFEKIKGVSEVISGYTGGTTENPSYDQVSSGRTGHKEAVLITYDPSLVTYEQLLEVFWRQVNPTDPDGQFVDRGEQYSTGIFYTSETQREAAESSKEALEQSGRYEEAVITPIEEAGAFYEAEDYHQDYYLKNEERYSYYRDRSGRDDFLEPIWSEEPPVDVEVYPSFTEEELREKLSPIQFAVTQEDDTEQPFNNEYDGFYEDGIYVDLISGEPLFSSLDKYDSGTGWPSFTRPLEENNLIELDDFSLGGIRTEIRSRHGNAHLGHVFTDGPEPTGLRYCMNSAALRFIPAADLEKEGYGEYADLFTK